MNKQNVVDVATRTHKRGDRKDGYLVAESDAMHAIMPYMLPNRADNEAVMLEKIDLTAANAYLNKKNADNPEFKYTLFHLITAALAKTITLRPYMNRFYVGKHLYDRKKLLFSFVVKKQFKDDAYESLAILDIDRESDISPLEQVHSGVKKVVNSVRKEGKQDSTTDKMDVLLKLPQFMLTAVFAILKKMDLHNKYPTSLMKDDPYYTSVFISNLGSIKMSANYHHLTNWGTNSIFVIIGEKKMTPFFEDDGTYTMKEAVELGITIDERIADGVYFANSIKILRKLLNNPELLELPITALVDKD